jgi:hypothetical protein
MVTPLEVEALSKSLGRWEMAEYVFAGLVTIACAGEYIAEFTDWWSRGVEDRKIKLSKASTLLLVFALAFELLCLVRTSEISGRIIGSLAERAGIAEQKAAEAINSAVAIVGKFGDLQSFVATKEKELDTQFGAFKRFADGEKKRTEAVIAELNSDRQKLDKSRTEAVAAANEATDALAAVNAARRPRTLNADQQRRITDAMSMWTTIPGSEGKLQQIAVYPINQFIESLSLANQIAAALGQKPGAGWDINRNRVNFGTEWVVLGVGILTSSNARGKSVAAALADALNKEGVFAHVLPQTRLGCEDAKNPGAIKHPETEPFCSQISVMVGDHP